MTFKHTQHWDSELSRSLEKVAIAKGLIKPEPAIKKSAAVIKQADTTPTSNLMENIFKLCAGMRSNGLIKEAVEVETNYLNYKSAQTLYEAFKETGDDVIQQAHPDGSHKMEDIDSDEATFEDILDQHVKILQVMDKKPSGKLSSTAQVLRAVKIVLSQDVTEMSTSQQESLITRNVNRADKIIQNIGPQIKNEMTVYTDYQRKADAIHEASLSTTVDNLEEMVSQIDALSTRIKPGSWTTLGFGGITENTWATVEPMLTGAIRLVNSAIQARKAINAQRGAGITKSIDQDSGSEQESSTLQVPETTVSGDPLSGRLDNLIERLQSFLAVNSVARVPGNVKWVNDQIAEVKAEQAKIANVPQGQRVNITPELQGNISALEQETNQFYRDWVKAK